MISILMPIYNGIEFLEESINSILNQSYTEWELIIGINGHPPNSEVFQKAKVFESTKIKIYDLINIKGKSNALNKMLNYCNYDWISLLDVDDKWMPNKLEKQIPYMTQYDVIGTGCKYFGDKTDIPAIPYGDITNFNFFRVNPIINSSCLLKKHLCFWNSNVNGVEDYDLWLRLRKQGKKFYNIKEILVLHRIHTESHFNAKGNNLLVAELHKMHMK
jgi:glycosyltransferase involved in cell wall biosynthesis